MAEYDLNDMLMETNQVPAQEYDLNDMLAAQPSGVRAGVAAGSAAKALGGMAKRGAATGAQYGLKGVDKMLGILEPLQYPEYAVASSVYEALRGRGRQHPAEAAYEGITGQRDTDWGDVAGIQRGKPTDTWGEWMSREVPRFALNTLGDPLNLLGGAGLITRPLSKAAKARPGVQAAIRALDPAREALGGTGFAKRLYRTSPKTPRGIEAEKAIENARQARRRMQYENQQLYEGSQAGIEDAMKEDMIRQLAQAERTGAGYGQLPAMMLRGLPEDAVKRRVIREMWETGDPDLPYWAQKGLEKQHARSAELRDRYNLAAPDIGAEEIGFRPEDRLTWTPRPTTPRGQRRMRKLGAQQDKAVLSPEKFSSRTLQKALDPTTGQPILEEGLPIVRKFEQDTWRGKPIELGEASLRDIESTMPNLFGSFVADPSSAYLLDADKKARQIAQVDLMKNLRDAELMYNISPTPSMSPRPARDAFDWQNKAISQMRGESELPAGLVGKSREVEIPGLKDMYAPKWLANRLENEAGVGPPLGRVGQLFEDYTRNWKRNTLALFPAYHLGNLISNQQLIYSGALPDPSAGPAKRILQGLTYPGQHIRNVADAERVRRWSAKEALPGISNRDLYHEIDMRGGLGAGMYAGEMLPEVMAKEPSSRTRGAIEKLAEFAEGRTPGAGSDVMTALGPVARFAEGWGRLNDYGLKLGSKVEDNARIAVILDYLKKNSFDPRMPLEEQKAMLDDAVRYGKDIMVDYGKATPFEQRYFNNQWIPFYNWNRGIAGQTAERVASDPARMARLGRFYDAVSEPLEPEDQAIAPDYINRSMASRRFLGYPLGTDPEGNEQLILQARLAPHSGVGDFLDPRNLPQFMNPLPKALASIASNQDVGTGQAIDPEAGEGLPGGLNALINPITGGPYSKAWTNDLFWQLPKMYSYLNRTVNPLGRSSNWATQRLVNMGITDAPRMTQLPGSLEVLSAITGFKAMPFDAERYGKRAVRKANENLNRAKYYMRDADEYGASPEEEARLEALIEQREREKARAMGQLD